MNTKLAVGALLSLMAMNTADAGIIPELQTLPLSAYTSELNALDPGGVLDGVRVYACDREPYASFFLEVAVAKGTIALADSLTIRFGRTLAVAAGGELEVSSDPEQWPEALEELENTGGGHGDALAELQKEANRLEAVLSLAVLQAERMPSLASRVPGLMQSAERDFRGITGKIKLLKVEMALKNSMGQLASTINTSARTANNLRVLVASLRP